MINTGWYRTVAMILVDEYVYIQVSYRDVNLIIIKSILQVWNIIGKYKNLNQQHTQHGIYEVSFSFRPAQVVCYKLTEASCFLSSEFEIHILIK